MKKNKNISDFIAETMGWKKIYYCDSGREIYSDMHYDTDPKCEHKDGWHWLGWKTPYKNLMTMPPELFNLVNIYSCYSGRNIEKHRWKPEHDLNCCKVFEGWMMRRHPRKWQKYGTLVKLNTPSEKRCQVFQKIFQNEKSNL